MRKAQPTAKKAPVSSRIPLRAAASKPKPSVVKAAAACAASIASLALAQAELAALWGAMTVRALASMLPESLEVCCDALVEPVRECGAWLGQAMKGLRAEADAWKTSGEQLTAFAVALDVIISLDAMEGGSEDTVPSAAASLLGSIESRDAPATPWFVDILSDCDIDAVLSLLRWRRDSVTVDADVYSRGLIGYMDGSAAYALHNNRVRFTVYDGEEEGVLCNPGDVAATLSTGPITSVDVSESGSVVLSYEVPADTLLPITLHVCVFGAPAVGSPFTIQRTDIDSIILALLSPERQVEFLDALRTSWLPDACLDLLYRGSRDGMTPASFHQLCDAAGPTLTLVRSTTGYTFGGFTSASWGSSGKGACVACDDAFVFAVESPHGGVVKYPIVKGMEHKAIRWHKGRGPCFSGAWSVHNGVMDPKLPFDKHSSCYVEGPTYEDVLGLGSKSWTGTLTWTPQEVEVFWVGL